MAKNKKPKFLEAETPDLLALLKETLSGDEVDEKATAKAMKITEELISRQPGDEGPISVDEALKAAADIMTEALNKVKSAYENEISMMEDSDGSDEPEEDEDEEEEEEEEEEEAPKSKKSKKAAKEEKPAKKSKKKAEPEEDEEDEDDSDEEEEDSEDDEDGEDYSDWSLKDLKKECRTRGIKVTKGMAKADMVKALEADDKE